MNRDKILEQALKHELKHELRSNADAAVGDGGCLDAETLAAWEDGGLDAKAMETAELHASNCARCQALLGTMARGVPAITAVEEPGRFRFWSWWLAPIAAATAAVTLWVVLPREQRMATAPSSVAAPPAVPAPARDANIAPPAKADSTVAVVPPAQAPVAARREQFAAKDNDAAAGRPDRQQLAKAEAPKLQEAAPAASADAIAAAPSPSPASATLQKNARLASASAEIASPNSTRRWRIVAGGVEFSTDQGASWIPVRANPAEALTHGVSPSGTICWLIGKDGVVLVTADGSIFAKVDLPVRVDVASITATDARSATVTTVDGRTFRTDDSGRNWRQN